MNASRVIRRFQRNYTGRRIRSQFVELVGIYIEVQPGGAIRYFPQVRFRENPPTNESPEKNMLQRVFSEIPPCADLMCLSWRELVRVVRRYQPDLPWRLEDETRDSASLARIQ